ncbi:MAG: folate-binding protein YgfZ [Alphaproteobacteria bacterium]|nr:folate-binding protein YgfZ [Alphaproteobacteria bacterium]
MTQACFALLPERGVLAVAGTDRRSFLQGLISNDVNKVGDTRAAYAAFLTPQGKYLHDFILIEHEEKIWLDAEAARLADLKRRLSMYRLRAKVELVEQPELAVAAIFGGGAAATCGLPAEAGAARVLGDGAVMVDPRLQELGVRAILPRAVIVPVLTKLGLTETDFAAWDRHRLLLGIPDGSRDLVPDKTILLEAGFDELNGVDWQKGCYIGQELTARTKYRGLIKRRLFPVQFSGPASAPGTLISADGKEAGELRSTRDEVGLALLRLPSGSGSDAPPLTVDGASLTPMRPAWMRLETSADSGSAE